MAYRRNGYPSRAVQPNSAMVAMKQNTKIKATLRIRWPIEEFSPGVERRVYRFFESKNFGVCNAFSHTKLTDQLETWHSKNALLTPGLNFSNTELQVVFPTGQGVGPAKADHSGR